MKTNLYINCFIFAICTFPRCSVNWDYPLNISKMNRNKKSLTITIFLFLFTVSLNAQINTWSTWINCGINYSTINTHNNALFEITPKYGINIGLEFPYSLNKHFSYVPEICIAQKGARLVELVPNPKAYFNDYNMKSTYIELPVSIKATIDFNNLSSFLKIGYYFDVNIWTNEVIKSGDTVAGMKSPNYHRPFDYGLQGGIGFEWKKKYSIQSRIYYGLYNLTNFYGPHEYYSNFVINLSVGYKFQKQNTPQK